MARLAGDIADLCGSQEDLIRLQADVLVPLELDVFAGRRTFACSRGRHHVRAGLHPVRSIGPEPPMTEAVTAHPSRARPRSAHVF